MASTVKLHPQRASGEGVADNPLPQLVRTPSGLAILELQGTINLPETDPESEGKSEAIPIGRISFPDYNPEFQDPSSTSWMKRVHLYVGQHQRLTGEAKKLPKALAVIRKRAPDGEDVDMADSTSETTMDELEVVEIVKYKLVFSHRPEPVGTG
ncbi:hypothetical protein DL766_002936 [Monosporascus sp. MC13-8B]|uniref:Sister chromatid cohesion protein Ctf8 n=1 Tax=Monosporascus cannonballus TaxID=155416 RepID=A0ABY0H2L5_9PEZI|nr:hypothetical protein DL762_007516 [Monosporascus cannonballus]RYO83529.1 hypothetical protein DL763_007854 [Monosporascus cannonballus]RYP34569.1 hypothetical protein DL766_002936 [Monosporascus sp. MC13-8B]